MLRRLIFLRFPYLKRTDVVFNYRPAWLKNVTGENLELDIYIEKFKMAFEFNGGYHLTDQLQKQRDLIKRLLCEKAGVKLFVYSLQTLHAEARVKGFNKLYPSWFDELEYLLLDYRARFRNDKSVCPTVLPPDHRIRYFKPHQKIRAGTKVYSQKQRPQHKQRKRHKLKGIAQRKQSRP